MDMDFTLTVSGIDVTKDVIRWALHDFEDENNTATNTSSINATIASPDNKYAGRFDPVKGEVSLSWSGRDGMMGPVEFALRIVNEQWDRGESYIEITALDWTERLDSVNLKGGFPYGEKVKESVAKIGKMLDMDVEDKSEESETNDDEKNMSEGFSGRDAIYQYSVRDLIKGKGQTPHQPQKQTNKDAASGASGDMPHADQGASGGEGDANKSPILDPEKLREAKSRFAATLENTSNQAGSTTITGRLVVVDYPSLKAKECLTILGAGPASSGKWYVKSVDHEWSYQAGYSATCGLLRQFVKKPSASEQHAADTAEQWRGATEAAGLDPGPTPEEKSKSGAPQVFYAKIYEKNKVYRGPRRLDAPSQATFTIGDGKHVVSFEAEVNVQVGKDGGDKIKSESIAVNMPKLIKLIDEEAGDWEGWGDYEKPGQQDGGY